MTFKNLFVPAFSLILGIFIGFATIGIIFGSILIIGYLLLVKNNKPNTTLFQEMNLKQYIGLFLIFIGISPFIQYFFKGFFSVAGANLYSIAQKKF